MTACRPLSRGELRALLDECKGRNGPRDRAYIILAVCTGLRVSEVLSLRRRDLVDYRGEIPAELQIAKRFIKRKKAGRALPMTDELKNDLKHWLEVLERDGFPIGSDPVFPSFRRRKAIGRSAVWKIIRRRAMGARIDVTSVGTHTLRKTFLQELIQFWVVDRKDPEAMRKLKGSLGHTQFESTEKYMASLTRKDLDPGFQAVSVMVFGGGESVACSTGACGEGI